VKHPNLFTATLAVLKEVYPCFAIVRNPLAVLLSWHTIEAPVNKGRLPYGEAFDESLKSALLSESNVIERQIIILNWYFSQYESHLPSENIIKYEDLISSGGRVLGVIDKDASMLNVPLNSRNTSSIYDKELVRGFASRLLDEKSTINNFYKHEEIEDLLKKWNACKTLVHKRIKQGKELGYVTQKKFIVKRGAVRSVPYYKFHEKENNQKDNKRKVMEDTIRSCGKNKRS
jgi:hypothetical protein